MFPQIFKYCKYEYLQETLNNLTLKSSRLDSFNDPLESVYQIKIHSNKLNGKELIAMHNKKKNYIDDKLKEICVICFSEVNNEPLMWSHYANEHKGICLKFDIETIFDREDVSCASIVYSSALPLLDVFVNNTKDVHLEKLLDSIINTKSIHWSYEKEIRMYKKHHSNDIFYFNEKSLKSVILGLRFDDKERETVQKLVATYNEKHKTNVKIEYALQATNSYQLMIRECNVSPQPYFFSTK